MLRARPTSRVLALAVLTPVLLAGAAGVASSAAVAPAPPAAAPKVQRPASETEPVPGGDLAELAPVPRVTAQAWAVYDARSDEVIAARDPSTPRPIASLAKLMTALVVIDRVADDAIVTVPAAVNQLPADAATMGLRAGERWPASDLLQAMLVYSANDAAIALASQAGGGDLDEFVELMNQRADEMQLDSATFVSPTGLDSGDRSSVASTSDLITLAETALRSPEVRAAVRTPKLELQRPRAGAAAAGAAAPDAGEDGSAATTATEDAIVLGNRNPLLGHYPGVDGVKTGFTDPAGYMLIVHQVDSDTGGELIVVTAHSSSVATRSSDAAALLDWGRIFRTDTLAVEGGAPLGSVPVLHSGRRVDVFACDDLVVSVRAGQRMRRRVIVPAAIEPPIAEGDEIGRLQIQVGDADAGSVSVCSSTTIRSNGWRDRARLLAGEYQTAWRAGTDEVEHAWREVRT